MLAEDVSREEEKRAHVATVASLQLAVVEN